MANNEGKKASNRSMTGRALVLAVIMLTMGQTGYLGSAQQSTSQTADGAHLSLGEAMTNITFQYNPGAASGPSSSTCIGTACMVKNFNATGNGIYHTGVTVMGNNMYFPADDGTNGFELWKSDGTEAGTVMVKDINSGSDGGLGSMWTQMIVVGSTLYFAADDGTNGRELWKSDGTEAGTMMVKDINSGNATSLPNWMAAVGNTLYFSANDTTHGRELWKSDGTSSGTVMVKDLTPNHIPALSNSNPNWLTAVGNTLFFTLYQANTTGNELWKSDGTASGTVMVKDIFPGPYQNSSTPTSLKAVGNTLYFDANDGTNGRELWKSDGTASGTVMVKDINSGSSDGMVYWSNRATSIGNTLYFTADDGTNGRELWKSDGTSSGTVMVKDINSSGGAFYGFSGIKSLGNTLYFSADDGTNGRELWKSDGTSSGTVMVKDINSSGNGFEDRQAATITSLGNNVYFHADDGTNGFELWKSDGTASGTEMVENIGPGSASGSVTVASGNLGVVGNTLYLIADDGTNGRELWTLSGGSGSGSTTNVTGATCTVSPSLPTGLSIDSGTCTISGTPSVYAANQTYTVHNGTNVAYEVYLSVSSDDPHTVVEGQPIEPIGFHDPYQGGATRWVVSPSLPDGLSIDPATGEVTGSVDGELANTVYTVTAIGDSPTDSGDGSGHHISPASNYVKIDAGPSHTCAIDVNGDLRCWGSDARGQLGDGGTIHDATTYTSAPSSTPVDLGPGRTAVSVSVGYHHTCAILDNGDLKCWGWDLWGALGDGGTTHDNDTYTTAPSTPVDLSTPDGLGSTLNRTAVAVSAGNHFTCVILDNNDLKCWGRDDYGQLGYHYYPGFGDGFTTAPYYNPIDLASDSRNGAYADPPNHYAVSVSAGDEGTCAVLNNGDVKCWGRDEYGQLGDEYPDNRTTSRPTIVPSDLGMGLTAVDVSAGVHHTCAILDNGLLKCWGRDDYGQLGDGSSTYGRQAEGHPLEEPSIFPIDLGPGRTAVAVSAGNLHTCAILDDGSVECWGLGVSGQLGDGGTTHDATTYTTAPSSTPIDLGAGRTAVEISGSGNHTCVILDNGDLKCWGENSHGQIGNEGNPSVDYSLPQTVSGGFSWAATSNAVASGDVSVFSYSSDKLTGGGWHFCALQDDDQPFCWGASGSGQLGVGATSHTYGRPTPSQVLHPANVTSMSGGGFHTCAIREDGSLICWGSDQYGQLGNGGNGYWDNSPGDQATPPLESALDLGPNRTALEVSAGADHTCVILDNGDIKCWGSNQYGQLGNGQTSYEYSIPSSVVDLGDGRTAVSLGKGGTSYHACAILDNGDLKCWGRDDYGQIGDGGTVSQQYPYNYGDYLSEPSDPIDLGTGRTAVAVALGAYFTCAILDNGSVKCWGQDFYGQLGDGGTSTHMGSPVSVDLGPGRTAVAITASREHACAILDTGDVKCWGANGKGQLGLGVAEPHHPSITYAPSHTILLGTGRTAVSIAASGEATCAILDDASMRCWGSFKHGNLGVEVFRVDVFWNNIPHNIDGGSQWPILVDDDTRWRLPTGDDWGFIEGRPNAWDTSALPLPTRSVSFSLISLADSDDDGLPDELPSDYDPSEGPTPGLVADEDDDDDGISDFDELAMGTDPTSPDTDGDGYCDGTEAVVGVCEAGPDAFPSDPSAHADTDGDGMPDTITGTSTSAPPLVEDTDDDGDGLEDTSETNTGLYVDGSDTGTDPLNPDTDFDGVCDGPNAVPPTCEAGPDGDPLGQPAEGTIYGLRNSKMVSIQPDGVAEGATYEVRPDLPPGVRLSAIGGAIYGTPTEVFGKTSFTVWANQTDGTSVETVFWIEVLEDTDGDGMPDKLPDDYDASEGDLVEDEDDDNDGVQDLDEGASGTDPTNPDGDGDGICDGPISFLPTCIAGPDSNPFGIQHPSPLLLVKNSGVATPIQPPNHVPDATWEVSPDLPLGMVLDPATGMISGTPAQAMANTTYTIWANQSDGMSIEAAFWLEVLEDTDGDGMPDELPDDYDASEGDLVEDEDDDNDGSSDLDEAARGTDPRVPDSDGDGVCDGPIAPANSDCTAQVDASSVEDLGPGYLWMLCCLLLLLLLILLLPLIGRDRTVLVGPEPENTRAEPEFIGGTGTEEDPFVLAPAEGVKPGQAVSSKETITIDGMSRIDMVLTDLGQGANGNRFGMRESGTDESVTRELPIDYGEITISMVFDDSVGGPTKEGGEFTGLLKLGRASVYLSWTVRVQPDGGRSVGDAKKGAAKKGAAVKVAASKPATKEEKKAAELERVRERSSTIDFATLGLAPSTGLAMDVGKGADEIKVSDGSKFADSGSARISDSRGTTVITWTGRDGDTLTGISGLTRAFAAAATVTAMDDLQAIKGIGPFLEEKLNALGITTYRQIANMDARLEDQVNEAIEFFPGRVRRDEWARQAGEFSPD